MDEAQKWQVFRWINGKNAQRYGFDFRLWTGALVRNLIDLEFGINLSVSSMGSGLAQLKLTPKKPQQRAYQRDPEAIDRWQHET